MILLNKQASITQGFPDTSRSLKIGDHEVPEPEENTIPEKNRFNLVLRPNITLFWNSKSYQRWLSPLPNNINKKTAEVFVSHHINVPLKSTSYNGQLIKNQSKSKAITNNVEQNLFFF